MLASGRGYLFETVPGMLAVYVCERVLVAGCVPHLQHVDVQEEEKEEEEGV